MVALHPLGPCIGLGSETASAWPMTALGLACLCRRGHRLELGPGCCGPRALLILYRLVARHHAVTTRGGGDRCRHRLTPRGPLRALAAQQRPQLLETQLRLLHGPHQPKIPPHHLDEPLTVGATRGIDRQPRDQRLAFCSTQRHGFCGLLHHRVLNWLSVTAADGAEQPWPTAACAWLGAPATAAEVQTTQARQPQPGGHRSPPW